MKTRITFEELARRNKEILDRQGPVTIEEARAQVERLRVNRKIMLPISEKRIFKERKKV